MRLSFTFRLMCFLFLLCSAASAATRYVDQASVVSFPPYTNWESAATNIQDAIDAADPGDTVLVADGVYATGARLVHDGPANRIAVTKAITVQSVNGPDFTFISGSGPMGLDAVRCAYVGSNAMLVGFTLTNGATWRTGSTVTNQSGGGAWCETSGTVSNCVVAGNQAYAYAGGVYQGIVNRCRIAGNYANVGGGLAGAVPPGASSSAKSTAPVQVINSVIQGNQAAECGGAMWAALVNCAIAGNAAGVCAGIEGSVARNCTITANTAVGLYGAAANSALINSISWGNTALTSVDVDPYNISMTNCCTTWIPSGPFVGCISSDPQFVSGYHISAASPCIGRGTNTVRTGVDMDGEAWRNPPSIGCDEPWETGATGALGVAIAMDRPGAGLGYPLNLTAVINGIATSNIWSFGDGACLTNSAVISHTWSNAGSYTVTLTAYNADNPGGVPASIVLNVGGGDVHYVNPGNALPLAPYTNWSMAATNIQDAVDAATDGDTVLVTNGVYAGGSRSLVLSMNRLVVNKAVRVQSVNGPEVTIIQGRGPAGDGAVRCAYLGPNARLSGFTLTGGATLNYGSSGEQSGGGVYCVDASAALSNCVISGNQANLSGGGANGGSLYGCKVLNNSAGANGGGLNSAMNGSGVVSNCVISGNRAVNFGGGGYSISVFNSAIAGNTAGNAGGGLCVSIANHCTILANTAQNQGGGVAYSSSTYFTSNSIIVNNTAATYPNFHTNGGVAAVTFSCTTPLPGGAGNITNDPQLVSLYHIASTSPCAGKGSNAVAGVDLDGEPWRNPPSIGCDEWNSPTGALSLAIGAGRTSTHAGIGVTFQAVVTGYANRSVWDFGDGTVVTNQPYLTHAWAANGTYNVRLTAYNNDNPTGVSTGLTIVVAPSLTRYVNAAGTTPVSPYSTWATAAATIQDAVDAADDGDMVLVTNGVYASGGRVSGSYSGAAAFNRVSIEKAITVCSVNGASNTVIIGGDGSNGMPVARCAYVGAGARLQGFTLTGGHAVLPDNTGGGAYAAASAIVESCRIVSNSATYGGGFAGGQCLRSVLQENSASGHGGGSYNATMLANCLVTRNNGEGVYGGACYNSTIAGNTGTGASSCTLRNSILQGNGVEFAGLVAATYNCCVLSLSGAGNIQADPLFVDPAGCDYRLNGASPCIDAGTNLVPLGVTNDMDGANRPLDSNGDGTAVFDMGAYEFNPVGQYVAPIPQPQSAVVTNGGPANLGNALYLGGYGYTCQVVLATGAAHGTVTTTNGVFNYVPAGTNYQGSDTFTWQVRYWCDVSVKTSAVGMFSLTLKSGSRNNWTNYPPVFKSGVPVMDGAYPMSVGSSHRIVNGRYENSGGGIAAPEIVDWNNDGLPDLVVGQRDGRIALFLNKGTRGHPVFNGCTYLKLSNGAMIKSWLGGCTCFGGGPEACAPRVADWNNDGRKDLLLGEWTSQVNLFIYLNVGTDEAPVFDRKLRCCLSSSPLSPKAGYPTTMPFVMDWNGDGIMDLISGDNPVINAGARNSLINVFIGTRKNHGPASLLSTYSNCELFFWNEYQPSDSFLSLAPAQVLTNACPLASRKSVVAADFGRGKPDLVTGLQDGTLWYSPNTGTRINPVYSNYVQLQAGGSNIVVGSAAKAGQDPAYSYGSSAGQNQNLLPAVNEARLAVGDLDGDGLADLVAGDVNGNLTFFSQYNPNPAAIDQTVVVLPGVTNKPVTLTSRVDSGHAVTYSLLAGPTNGTLSGASSNLFYTPNPGCQVDRLTFVVADGSLCSTGTVCLTVKNYAPVAGWISPVTMTPTAVMNMNTSLVIALTATDAGNAPLTYSIVSPPTNGAWSLVSDLFTYAPTSAVPRMDSFTYKANNGVLDSNIATVKVDVCVRAVTFQAAANTNTVAGYLKDDGSAYDSGRGYGWDVSRTGAVYTLNANCDPRMDTVIIAGTGAVAVWSCSMPNGTYYVSLGSGYWAGTPAPGNAHQDIISVQGVTIVSNAASSGLEYVPAGPVPVVVSTGVLSVAVGGGASPGRLDFIEVRAAYQASGSATFLQTNTTTQGSWKGAYGADGYVMMAGNLAPYGFDTFTYFPEVTTDPLLSDLPPYAAVVPSPLSYYLRSAQWAYPTTDPRALQHPVLNTGLAAAWSGNPAFDVSFNDGQAHRVALYFLSWGNNSLSEQVCIQDAGNGSNLDVRTVSAFGGGKWLVWSISGHVRIQLPAGGLVSGIFLGDTSAPEIVEHPQDSAVKTGQPATFRVLATGQPLYYQWQRSDDGWTWDDIPGANSDTCTFAASVDDNGAWFSCVVSNVYGTDVSFPAFLAVSNSLPEAPVITSPLTVTANYGQAFRYVITASNDPASFDAFLPPSGFRLDRELGVITGPATVLRGGGTSTPSSPGTLYIPIRAINDGGEDAQVLTVIINTNTAPVINSPLSVTGIVGSNFAYTITANNSPTGFSAANLPAGFAVNTVSGSITGTPTLAEAGTTYMDIGAKNSSGTGLARVVFTVVDTHGIPASWLVQNFGSAGVTGSGAYDDPDGDGMNNYQEWIAGTSPTNPLSLLQLSRADVQAETNIVIRWSGVEGRSYAIQFSTNIMAGFNINLATNIPAAPVENVATVNVGYASGFLKVKVE